MTMTDGPRDERPQTSTRDYDQLRAQLEGWLTGRVPGATVSEDIPFDSGTISSDTVAPGTRSASHTSSWARRVS